MSDKLGVKMPGNGPKMRKKARPKTTGAKSISSLDSGVLSAGTRTADLNDDALSVATVETAADSGFGAADDVASTIDENPAALSPLSEKEQILIVTRPPDQLEDEVKTEQPKHSEVEVRITDEKEVLVEDDEVNEDEITFEIGLDEVSLIYLVPKKDIFLIRGFSSFQKCTKLLTLMFLCSARVTSMRTEKMLKKLFLWKKMKVSTRTTSKMTKKLMKNSSSERLIPIFPRIPSFFQVTNSGGLRIILFLSRNNGNSGRLQWRLRRICKSSKIFIKFSLSESSLANGSYLLTACFFFLR